jgi:hypothetical protein
VTVAAETRYAETAKAFAEFTYLLWRDAWCTVHIFRKQFALDAAIGSHACSLEASNGIPLGCPLFLPVHTANCVQTLKVTWPSLHGTLRQQRDGLNQLCKLLGF